MKSGTSNFMQYQIYLPNTTTVWDSTNKQSGAGTGLAQSIPYKAAGQCGADGSGGRQLSGHAQFCGGVLGVVFCRRGNCFQNVIFMWHFCSFGYALTNGQTGLTSYHTIEQGVP